MGHSGCSDFSLFAVSIIAHKKLLASRLCGSASAACAKNGSFLSDLPLKPCINKLIQIHNILSFLSLLYNQYKSLPKV